MSVEFNDETTPDEDAAAGRVVAGIKVESFMFAGWSAGELRAAGVRNVPEDVPDCAVLNAGGAFEWIEEDIMLRGPSGTNHRIRAVFGFQRLQEGELNEGDVS